LREWSLLKGKFHEKEKALVDSMRQIAGFLPIVDRLNRLVMTSGANQQC
jgi:hypothetical protein